MEQNIRKLSKKRKNRKRRTEDSKRKNLPGENRKGLERTGKC
jgi:hypothetical protein